MTGPRRWPLVLIAAPAAVSIWSGWVGLGQLCGFGLVHPLPGIWPGLQLDTAITLPVGVEAYGAYALGAWLSLAADHPARAFARRSAVGSLLLGMLGQVAYHLLAAWHAHRAPWPVVVLVSCLPVVTLGFGAALTHLLRAVPEPAPVRVPVPGAAPEAHPAPRFPIGLELAGAVSSWPAPAVPPPAVPEAGTPVPEAHPAVPEPPAELNGHGHLAAEMFAAEVAAGDVPSIRTIRSGLRVGQDKARQVQAYLETLTPAATKARRRADRKPPGAGSDQRSER
ncbi:MAG TPA: hypothetical protein VK586_12645 [Streptosporangiaceae bacterium]|nr:hypothetical protein [Streptosporangiaceae bacterium]